MNDTESKSRPRPIRSIALLSVLVVIAAACGSHSHKAAAPTTVFTVPTTTVPPTTTTTSTTIPPPQSPLTGLPEPTKAQLAAPAVVVKIDNVDPARPQTGVNEADIVYEEMVEGGLTRLAAVFQSHYPTQVGPVRSGRLTDEGIIDDLNHPVFVYAGANGLFLPVLRSQPITDIDADNTGSAFYRTDYAPAPHNLYTDVASDAGLSTYHTPPGALFQYSNTFSGTPAATVTVSWPAATATWTWNGTEGIWLRAQNGTPDVVRDGPQIGATNVVVQAITYTTAAQADESGVITPIPSGSEVGTGPAWFFSAGKEAPGTWSRSSLTTVTSYKTSGGAPVHLRPGATWIELIVTGTTPSVTP